MLDQRLILALGSGRIKDKKIKKKGGLMLNKLWGWLMVSSVWIANVYAVEPVLTLANRYQVGVDVTEYWVSEKYDGVRGYWDGQHFFSRQGYRMNAPVFFTEQLPNIPLDGELWLKREAFSELLSIVTRDPQHAEYLSGWQQISYRVFDAPNAPGNFVQRYHYLQEHLRASAPNVYLVEQHPIESHHALMKQLELMSAQGAEGLMLRKLDAPYRGGRSNDLLKVKLWEDAEARVLVHLPGKGQFTGLMGSLLVQWEPEGPTFKIGSGFNRAERENPPPVGSLVTFRYQGVTHKGVPRFPVYWRLKNEEY